MGIISFVPPNHMVTASLRSKTSGSLERRPSALGRVWGACVVGYVMTELRLPWPGYKTDTEYPHAPPAPGHPRCDDAAGLRRTNYQRAHGRDERPGKELVPRRGKRSRCQSDSIATARLTLILAGSVHRLLCKLWIIPRLAVNSPTTGMSLWREAVFRTPTAHGEPDTGCPAPSRAGPWSPASFQGS